MFLNFRSVRSLLLITALIFSASSLSAATEGFAIKRGRSAFGAEVSATSAASKPLRLHTWAQCFVDASGIISTYEGIGGGAQGAASSTHHQLIHSTLKMVLHHFVSMLLTSPGESDDAIDHAFRCLQGYLNGQPTRESAIRQAEHLALIYNLLCDVVNKLPTDSLWKAFGCSTLKEGRVRLALVDRIMSRYESLLEGFSTKHAPDLYFQIWLVPADLLDGRFVEHTDCSALSREERVALFFELHPDWHITRGDEESDSAESAISQYSATAVKRRRDDASVLSVSKPLVSPTSEQTVSSARPSPLHVPAAAAAGGVIGSAWATLASASPKSPQVTPRARGKQLVQPIAPPRYRRVFPSVPELRSAELGHASPEAPSAGTSSARSSADFGSASDAGRASPVEHSPARRGVLTLPSMGMAPVRPNPFGFMLPGGLMRLAPGLQRGVSNDAVDGALSAAAAPSGAAAGSPDLG